MSEGELPWHSEEDVGKYQSLFPLLPNYVVHDTFGNRRWSVGLSKKAPEHLRNNLFAAIVASTRDIGLSYAKQRYVTQIKPPRELGLTDEIDHLFEYGQSRFKYYLSFAIDAPKPDDGYQDLSLQFFYRNLGGFDAAKRLSELGYLCEVATILRTTLEQFAFSAKLWGHPGTSDIRSIKPIQCLNYFKTIVPIAGRLYGPLSKYTHFEYDHHTHFFSVKADKTFTIQRHPILRAYATHLLFMTMACLAAYILQESPNQLQKSYKSVDELSQFIKQVDSYSDEVCKKLPLDSVLANFDILLQTLTLKMPNDISTPTTDSFEKLS